MFDSVMDFFFCLCGDSIPHTTSAIPGAKVIFELVIDGNDEPELLNCLKGNLLTMHDSDQAAMDSQLDIL